MRTSLAFVLAVSLIGCSQQGNSAKGNGTAGNAGAAAPPPAAAEVVPRNPLGMRRYAECAQRMEAVADLYDSIADVGRAEKAAEMRALATSRRAASEVFDRRAGEIATAIGQGTTEVDMMRVYEGERLERERGMRPFEEFAVWLGREADSCAPLAAPAS